MAEENNRTVRDHKYHAEAAAVEGLLELPYAAKIERQAHAKVRPEGGYESQHAKPFRIEGVVSYGTAHTQAAGHEEKQNKGRVFKTLATSVVENLNILNVVTCDRVVAQVSTTHPRYEDEGHVPMVTFLGTQFYNLRIGGFPVEVELDLELLNPEEHSPKVAYTKSDAFKRRIADRLDIFRRKESAAPADVQQFYAPRPPDKNGKECTQYSLVKGLKGTFPGKNFGNVLDVPNFGKIHLALVCIEHSDYKETTPQTTLIDLTMIKVDMGCIGTGTLSCTVAKTNGGPGTGG